MKTLNQTTDLGEFQCRIRLYLRQDPRRAHSQLVKDLFDGREVDIAFEATVDGWSLSLSHADTALELTSTDDRAHTPFNLTALAHLDGFARVLRDRIKPSEALPRAHNAWRAKKDMVKGTCVVKARHYRVRTA